MDLRRRKSVRLAARKATEAIGEVRRAENSRTVNVDVTHPNDSSCSRPNCRLGRTVRTNVVGTNIRNTRHRYHDDRRTVRGSGRNIMSHHQPDELPIGSNLNLLFTGLLEHNDAQSESPNGQETVETVEETAVNLLAPAVDDGSNSTNASSTNTVVPMAGRRMAMHHHILEYRIARTYRAFNPTPVKGESYCECPKQDRDLECGCGEEDAVLEWLWDSKNKSAAADVSENQQKVKFHVNYSSGTASIRGSQLMADRQYFWEIKMTSPVYGTDMMVGVGTANVDLDAHRHTFTSMLGSDAESWGLSYYGRTQHRGQFSTYENSQFGQGSIIGIHLDMWHGELSFYKNRKPLGVAFRGLAGKKLYPMMSSTAARTSMKVINATSFKMSLQFLCCQKLRQLVPTHLTINDVFALPPGLRAFLDNNLLWLLRPIQPVSSVTTTRRKRARSEAASDDESQSFVVSKAKWLRTQAAESSDSESDS